MRTLRYVDALGEALDEVLTENDRVTVMGGGFGGLRPSPTLQNVYQKHAARMKYPPIAELGYCGIAIGAAMVGIRPIVHLGTSTFSYEAIPQIVNEAAIACSNSAGQTTVPVVFHMFYGVRGAGGVQHSGSPQAWYWNTPGLQVAMPGSPADVKGLFRWAVLQSANPTVFMNHQGLLDEEGPVADGPYEIPFGQAEIEREGTDVTIVAASIQVPRALAAAETLAREDGIQAEVVNPRTLQPLDKPTLLASVRKTGRVVVTDESHDTCGVAAGLAAIIADEGFDALKAPIKRVTIPHVPIPYAESLETYVTPTADRIVAAVRQLLARR
jgi:acetoin:2,6-dichlorophenolindophenol oxidoreductase subunit beta